MCNICNLCSICNRSFPIIALSYIDGMLCSQGLGAAQCQRDLGLPRPSMRTRVAGWLIDDYIVHRWPVIASFHCPYIMCNDVETRDPDPFHLMLLTLSPLAFCISDLPSQPSQPPSEKPSASRHPALSLSFVATETRSAKGPRRMCYAWRSGRGRACSSRSHSCTATDDRVSAFSWASRLAPSASSPGLARPDTDALTTSIAPCHKHPAIKARASRYAHCTQLRICLSSCHLPPLLHKIRLRRRSGQVSPRRRRCRAQEVLWNASSALGSREGERRGRSETCPRDASP
jgi:hypothetical protein